MTGPVWERPGALAEALHALGDSGARARAIAGGTDLAAEIKTGAVRPDVLVDLGRARELSRLVAGADGEEIVLGALATHAAIARNEVIRSRAPALAAACGVVGSPQSRARGTIGGNVANASPAADGVIGLLAHDAVVRVASSGGPSASREVPLDGFFTGPGRTVLGPGELVQEVAFLLPSPRARGVYLKAGQRNALAIAIASVAVVFDPDRAAAAIALGSVAPTPVRATAAERLLAAEWESSSDRGELVRAVATEAVKAACCIDDVRASAGYRRTLVQVLTERALREVCLA